MITINVRPNLDLETSIKGISLIVSGSTDDDIPYQKDNGSWVLDRGNNWFLQVYANVYQITYRYENSVNREALEGLQKFLEWTYGEKK